MIDGLGPAQLARYRAAIRAHQRGMPATAPGGPAADTAAARALTSREAGLLVRHALRAFAAGDGAALLGLPAPRTTPEATLAVSGGAAAAGRDAALLMRLLAALPASLAEIFPGDANHDHLRQAADVLVRRLLRMVGAEAGAQPGAGIRQQRQSEIPAAANPHQFVPVPVPLPRRRARAGRRAYAGDAGQDCAGDDVDLLRALLAAIRRQFRHGGDAPADRLADAAADEPLTLDDWLRRTHGALVYGPDGGAQR